MINGEIKSKSKARIIRDGVVVYSGEIQSILEKIKLRKLAQAMNVG